MDLNEQVGRELDLIPRGSPGNQQQEFRARYEMRRLASLGSNPEVSEKRRETIAHVVAEIRRDDPGFEPAFDSRLATDETI